MGLQRTAGNRATTRLLTGGSRLTVRRRPSPAGGAPAAVQRCGPACGCTGCADEKDPNDSEGIGGVGEAVQRSSSGDGSDVHGHGHGAATVQRSSGDATQMSITPEWAAGLDDAELAAQTDRVARQLRSLPEGDPVRDAAESNLAILRQQQQARVRALGAEGVGWPVPRPAGLPVDEGYQLTPLQGLPPELVDAIPEGQLVELDLSGGTDFAGGGLDLAAGGIGSEGGFDLAGGGLDLAAGPGLGPMPEGSDDGFSLRDVTEPLGAGGAVALHRLGMEGFGAAGQNAIGIVAYTSGNVSPPRLPGKATVPWGHVVLVIYQDGRLAAVRDYNPKMGWDLLAHSGAVKEGRHGVDGMIRAGHSAFTARGAISATWPVDARAVNDALEALAPMGRAGDLGHPPFYTGVPGSSASCTNCGLWAINEVEQRLGGRLGRAGPGGTVPVTDIGGPRTAAQGELMKLLKAVERGEARLGDMPGSTGPPVVTQAPTRFKVIKIAGKGLFWVGIGVDAYEFTTASTEQKPRVAAGIGGAAAGAWAGAKLGLVCGKGALVCSPVLGIVGAIGGRAAIESIYDALLRPGTGGGGSPCIDAYRNARPSNECPNCHTIRRVQECRDDDPFRRPGSMFDGFDGFDGFGGFGADLPFGQAGPSAAGGADPAALGSAESNALLQAARQGGSPTTGPLSPEEVAAIRAWIAAD